MNSISGWKNIIGNEKRLNEFTLGLCAVIMFNVGSTK